MTQKKKPTNGKKKPKKGKAKKAIVYYPSVISNPGQDASDEPLTEDEISYKDKILAIDLERFAKKGLSNNELISALGISRSTFYSKLRNEPYFAYCLYKHREIAVKEVECALFNSAKGFHYKEEQATPMGVFEVKKYALPSVLAQKEFLYNRAPGEWRKKIVPEIEVNADVSQINVIVRRRE